MGAMQSRPPMPSQASLFDAPPGPDTLPDPAMPAIDGAQPVIEAAPPPLPLPGFLASDDAAMCTAQEFTVDAGWV